MNNNANSSNNVNFSFPDFEEFTSSFSSNDDDNSSNNSTNFDNSNPFSNIDINTIFKMKNILESMNSNKNNPRSNLLLSLKPYLNPRRKQKVDQYIQLFNISLIMENFKSSGGENNK